MNVETHRKHPGPTRCTGARPAGWLTIGLLIGLIAAARAAVDVRRDATVEAVEKVMPAVVNIATKTVVPVRDPFEAMFRRFYGQQPSDTLVSLGSGVMIDEAGYLLTNDHVVRRADQIGVKFNTGTNVYEAAIIASDPKRDVALLKLKASPGAKFPAIKLANEDDLLLGETVLALGNPYGLGGSVARGILSSKSRTMPEAGAVLNIPNWLQTDAPINVGNSGGPLINLRGELIGINVAVLNEVNDQPVQGIGFAIPIRLVEEALADILPTEFVRSFWFGARVKVGSSPLVITSVQPESPAGRAGLKVGDAVLQVNGETPRSFIDFADLLATNAAAATLSVQRGAERRDVTVRLVPEKTVFNPDMVRGKLGLALDALTAQDVARHYGLKASGGFIITGVQKGGPAEAAGLQNGILILAIDGQVPSDPTAMAKILYSRAKGDRIRLDIAIREEWAGGFRVLGQAVELSVR